MNAENKILDIAVGRYGEEVRIASWKRLSIAGSSMNEFSYSRDSTNENCLTISKDCMLKRIFTYLGLVAGGVLFYFAVDRFDAFFLVSSLVFFIASWAFLKEPCFKIYI